MPVQLPPPRRLPDPERMLAEILSGDGNVVPIDRRRRRTRAVGALLVAAALVAVGAIAVPIVVHQARSGTVAATPSSTPPSSPSSSPTPQESAAGHLALGSALRFPHFTVTVSAVSHNPMFGILVRAEVCVRSLPPNPTGKTTRVSWDPWTVATGERRTTASLRKAPAGLDPPKHLFPRERYLRVGQCAGGWIPFNADEHANVVAVVYANSLGDTAAWAGQ